MHWRTYRRLCAEAEHAEAAAESWFSQSIERAFNRVNELAIAAQAPTDLSALPSLALPIGRDRIVTARAAHT
jgi:hypothetical protein